MFDWLFEARTEIFWLLGILGVILLVVWWRFRKRNLLIAAGAIVALAGVYFLLSKIRETPRAQVERKLHEMADAVKARDTDAIFKHVAKDFTFQGRDRATFRKTVETALKGGTIEELVIYGEEWPDGADGRTLPVTFKAKPKAWWAQNTLPYPVKAKFVLEDDGQWRMQSFEVYNPVLSKERMEIPNLP
ncbi:MAG TPA: hypothetical protein VKA46_04485 [Gemmataceae bacterium]|nr:hypothetical protein [Gemmataceae bacterium]